MEAVLSWLNRPLVPDSPILIWMALALCAGLALALILVLALVRKRKKRAAHEKDPVTAKPGPLPVLELANLQGLGSREEQQDAFGISPVSRLEEDGLLAVDAAEAALLLQLGYDAGLLTHEEAQALVEPVAQMVLGHFTSWEELLQNLLDGRCVTDGLDEGSEALQAMTERLDALREGDDDKDPLFDDALFSEQLVPLEGVSASSLLP